MTPEPPIAVLDANVLYPQFLRDVLLRLAAVELFRPRWSDRIHDEWVRNVLENRPDLTPDRLQRTRRLMEEAFPTARVTGFEPHEALFAGVHAKDRHVAAAALQAGASHIVTWNVRDFPASSLSPHGIAAADPDAFLCTLLKNDTPTVRGVLERHRTGLLRPPHSKGSYRSAFLNAGLTRAAGHLP